MKIIRKILALLMIAFCTLVAIELSLRAFKSYTYDGIIHIRTSSINNSYHPKLGWISPASRSYEKHDKCYGSGVVSYNEEGFRSPSTSQLSEADPLICVIGDSTVQGYQLPDGTILSHLLRQELEKEYPNVYVLSLGVGGYNSVQEYLLYEQFCKPRNPDVRILLFSQNDIAGNSEMSSRYGSIGTFRPTPFSLERPIQLKVVHPLTINHTIDQLMIMKVLNLLYVKLEMFFLEIPEVEKKRWLEEGYRTLDTVAKEFGQGEEIGIFVAFEKETRALETFEKHNHITVALPSVPDAMRCLPRDPHLNKEGHKFLYSKLIEPVKHALKSRIVYSKIESTP